MPPTAIIGCRLLHLPGWIAQIGLNPCSNMPKLIPFMAVGGYIDDFQIHPLPIQKQGVSDGELVS